MGRGSHLSARTSALGPAGSVRPVVSPALVGRDRELRAVLAAVRQSPAVVVVEGEAGVGKTRLIGELSARPELAERRQLVGRCRQIREPFPLGPVVDALRGVGDDLRGLRLGLVAGALRSLIPELAEWLPPAPDPLDDRAAERHRVFRAVAEVLSALTSSAAPVILVLEDLHWADEQTREFIAFWLSNPTPHLSLVVTYRSEDVDTELRALTARSPVTVAHEHVTLAPLDAAATGALTAAILGNDTVSAEFAAYLWDRTGGLPLAVEEVLALVRARGLLVFDGRTHTWSRKALDELNVPRGIRDPTLQRVAGLPEPTQRLAEAAAVVRSPAPLSLLLAMVGGPDGSDGSADMIGAVEQAIDCGLLVEDGDTLAFRHVLAAEAVYENLSGPRRRMLHARSAAALRRMSPAPLGRIAYHLGHADDPRAWVAAADAAADQAIALGHEDEAVHLLTEVLSEAPLTGARRGELAIKLGWAALDTLHARSAIGPLSRALERDPADQEPSGPRRAELQFLLTLALGQAGEDFEGQRRLLLDAIPELDRPDLLAWASVAVCLISPADVPVAEDRAWLKRALELLPNVDDPLLEVFVLGKAGSFLVLAGDPEWREITERVLRITNETPRQRREANAYYSIGSMSCYAGQLSTADRLLARGLLAPAVQENRRIEMLMRSGRVLLHLFQGRWTGLQEETTALLAELNDYALGRVDVELVAGVLALARGDLDEASQRLDVVTELVGEIGAIEVVPVAAAAAARVAFARGDVPAALACLDLMLEPIVTKDMWPTACWGLPTATEIWCAAGRHAEAGRFLDRAEVALRDLDAPLAAAALSHGRGILAGSADQLIAAAAGYDEVPAPYEAARAREHAAVRLLAAGPAGSGVAGESQLRLALATYHSLGATWDYRRAAAVARGHGMSLPSRQRGGVRKSYGNSLSPREREVAELAATGRSNKEIAAALFVSMKTVDHHMAAAMRKLGVRSRTALAHRLSTADSGTDGEIHL